MRDVEVRDFVRVLQSIPFLPVEEIGKVSHYHILRLCLSFKSLFAKNLISTVSSPHQSSMKNLKNETQVDGLLPPCMGFRIIPTIDVESSQQEQFTDK